MDCTSDCTSCPLAGDEQAKFALDDLTDSVADFVAGIACRIRVALALLVESHDYAVRFHRSLADFPVEAAELKNAGLTSNDLRGLVYAGIVEQVPFVTGRSLAGGNGQRLQPVAIPDTACFILTEKGLALARLVLATPSAAPPVPDGSGNGQPAAAVKPRWDADRQELYVGATLVKRFKVPAANQVRILDVFEEEGWPARVDDPLPCTPGVDPKRRLHHTINSLNGNQSEPLIHFMGDGTGTGIRWEVREATHDSPGENGHAPNASSENGQAHNGQNGHSQSGLPQNGHAHNGLPLNGRTHNGHSPSGLAVLPNGHSQIGLVPNRLS